MAKNKKSGQYNPTTQGSPDSVRGNLGALIIEVQKTNALLESDSPIMDVQTRALENINFFIADIYADVHAIAEQMAGDKLKELEAAKERDKQMQDMIEALKEKRKPDEKPKKDGDFSWLGLAASLVTGLVAGGMAFIANYLKGLQTLWSGITKALKIDGIILKLFNVVKNGFMYIDDLISKGFSKAWGFISKVFDNKLFATVANFFTKMFNGFAKLTGLTGIMDEFADLWKNAKGIFGMIFGPESAMAKFFGFFGKGGGGFISYFDDLLKFFQPLTSFFKGLGSILGKLAVPLQVIMSIWDTVSGALDGWNKTEGTFMDKLFGAIQGGLSGLLNGLIGGLLDLLKDGLSWILEFFGMKDAAAWLDSFSFKDMITNTINAIGGFIKGIINSVIEFFQQAPGQMIESISNAVANIGQAAKDVLKYLLRMVLPDPSKGMAQKLASKAIPDSIYEFAGMDPKTGKITEEKAPEAQPAGAMTGQSLQQAQVQNTNATAEVQQAQAAAAAEGTKLNLRPSLQRQQQSAGPSVVPITSTSTKWDPEDAMARGAYGLGA